MKMVAAVIKPFKREEICEALSAVGVQGIMTNCNASAQNSMLMEVLYTFNASYDTPITKCTIYHYLNDYEAAKNMPCFVGSSVYRQSAHRYLR